MSSTAPKDNPKDVRRNEWIPKILIKAINKAIRGGAVAAPAMQELGEDNSYVRTQTDVGIESSVLEAYLAELKANPDMAAFDQTFANVPHGGGVSVNLSGIGRLPLAIKQESVMMCRVQ